ncbi:hypothetical protein R6Z07M_014739 [Ovis aries]
MSFCYLLLTDKTNSSLSQALRSLRSHSPENWQLKPQVQVSDLEFAHFPSHRKRSCAEPGSSEKRKPSHRTQRWEITCNLSTLPRAPSTASAVSPGSRPHPPPQKRGTRSTAKDSASLGLADELCKLQKLNRGHTTCPSQQRREEGGLGRIPTLLGRGWGRWRAGAPLAAPRTPSSRSLLELQHPSSRPSSELRWEKGPERRGSWGAQTLGRPSPPSLPLAPSSPAPPSSARRRVESRIGDLGEPDAGRTGQTLGGRRGKGTGGGTLAATPPCASSAPPTVIGVPDTKAGTRAEDPAAGKPPDAAHSPHLGGSSDSPGRPRWLRHPARRFPRKTRPPGSLPARLPEPRSLLLLLPPLRGSVGAAAPGLGRRGGGGGSTTTWPPGAGPRRPGSRGSREGGANHSPPLPPRAAPNSASQVIRPRAPAATCGRCSWPARPMRPQPVCSFPRIVGFCPVDLFASSSPEANGNHRCSDPLDFRKDEILNSIHFWLTSKVLVFASH